MFQCSSPSKPMPVQKRWKSKMREMPVMCWSSELLVWTLCAAAGLLCHMMATQSKYKGKGTGKPAYLILLVLLQACHDCRECARLQIVFCTETDAGCTIGTEPHLRKLSLKMSLRIQSWMQWTMLISCVHWLLFDKDIMQEKTGGWLDLLVHA